MELYAVFISFMFLEPKHQLVGVYSTQELAQTRVDEFKDAFSIGTLVDVPKLSIGKIELDTSITPHYHTPSIPAAWWR